MLDVLRVRHCVLNCLQFFNHILRNTYSRLLLKLSNHQKKKMKLYVTSFLWIALCARFLLIFPMANFDITGMGILPHLRIFFSVLPIFRISAVSSFNQREREMRKKCLQNNPNRASEINAEKLLTKNIPNRASAL